MSTLNSRLAMPRSGQKGRRGALSSTESLKRILQMRVTLCSRLPSPRGGSKVTAWPRTPSRKKWFDSRRPREL